MLWFQRKAAIEAYEQALANYRQTVLEAFAQVADTLHALEYDAEALHAQSQALDAAGQAQQLMKASYDSGIVDYLQLLITNAQYHQARIGYLQARAQRLQDTAALFVALGGGWWNAENNSLSAER
jgi:outer membrane protein TolC